MLLDILVPKAGSALDQAIERMSAVVASREEQAIPGIRVVYYEGNAFGASNLNEYHERLVSAAGRLEARYPTSSLMGVDPEDADVVAVFDTESAAVIEVFDEAALVTWSGESLEAICGRLLEEGVVDYEGAVSVVQNGKQLGGQRGAKISYRSRAGQVIELDFARKVARVASTPAPFGQAAPFRP